MGSEPAKARPPGLQAAGSRSLQRALAILELCVAADGATAAVEISQKLGIGRSSAHRYLSALARLGYLRQDLRRRYVPTLCIVELGMQGWYAVGLTTHAAPGMTVLAGRSGLAVELTVLDGSDAVVVHRVERPAGRRRRPDLAGNARQPAHCTAAGKLLLAHLPAAAQEAVLAESGLVDCAPATVTEPAELRSLLARARAEGLAAAEDERAAGVSSIAAPIYQESSGVVAAISLVSERYGSDAEQLREQHGALLLSAARAISTRLGG